jgi:hypothetical protein
VPVAQGAQEIQAPIFNINRGIVNRKMKAGYTVPRKGARNKKQTTEDWKGRRRVSLSLELIKPALRINSTDN